MSFQRHKVILNHPV